MIQPPPHDPAITRRSFLRGTLRHGSILALGTAAGVAVARTHEPTKWQIDPDKCIQCGMCATHCVLNPSAVKCFHANAICGYCELCTGYFEPQPYNLDTGAENQLCPLGALTRRYIEEPYFEYRVEKELCIGCGKCVKGCTTFGNGSLFLQVDQSICVNCNRCSIAAACPAQAFERVTADKPYQLKTNPRTG